MDITRYVIYVFLVLICPQDVAYAIYNALAHMWTYFFVTLELGRNGVSQLAEKPLDAKVSISGVSLKVRDTSRHINFLCTFEWSCDATL